jgi:hypothetical protein
MSESLPVCALCRSEPREVMMKAPSGMYTCTNHNCGLSWTSLSRKDWIKLHRPSEKLKEAAKWLEEAAVSIKDWGSYANDYFQMKHALEDEIALFRDRAKQLAEDESEE